MLDLSLARDIVTIASFLIALTYYILNIRHQRQARKIQLSMSITERLGSKEFLKDYVKLTNRDWTNVEDFLKKYDSQTNTEESAENFAARWSLWAAYENLGYLLKQGLVDADVIYNSQGTHPMLMWAIYHPVFMYYRENELGSNYFEYFEYLSNSMWKIGRKKGLTTPDFDGSLLADQFKDIFETTK